MQFVFTLGRVHGASGSSAISVPRDGAGDLADRVYGMKLVSDGNAYPVGHVVAREFGSDDCEYDVAALEILTGDEREELEAAVREHLERESEALTGPHGDAAAA